MNKLFKYLSGFGSGLRKVKRAKDEGFSKFALKEGIKKIAREVIKLLFSLLKKGLLLLAGPMGMVMIFMLTTIIAIGIIHTPLQTEERGFEDYIEFQNKYHIPLDELAALVMAFADDENKTTIDRDDIEKASAYLINVNVKKYEMQDICTTQDDGTTSCYSEKVLISDIYYTGDTLIKEFGKHWTVRVGELEQDEMTDVIYTNIPLKEVQNIDKDVLDKAINTDDSELYKAILKYLGLDSSLYGGDGNYIGMCVGDVQPGGEAINVSQEVIAYKPVIERYASMYGMEEYVGWLQAMMMQESGGRGGDPMQASEGKYAPQLTSACTGSGPSRIGCITDPEISIHAGVLEFRDALNLAGGDMMIAVQTYNFGPYFATWIKDHGGKYTIAAAEEYSRTIMAAAGQGLGTPEHAIKVAQYYDNPGSCTELGDGATSSDRRNYVANVGRKYIGHSSYGMGWGRNQSDIDAGRFDCSSFVHWSFLQIGIELGPLSSVTTDSIKNYSTRISPSDIRVGDLIYFDTYKVDGHVAIYAGNGEFINCQSSYGVHVESINNSYWKSHFKGHVRTVNGLD